MPLLLKLHHQEERELKVSIPVTPLKRWKCPGTLCEVRVSCTVHRVLGTQRCAARGRVYFLLCFFFIQEDGVYSTGLTPYST